MEMLTRMPDLRRILVFVWVGPAMSFLVIAALTASGGAHQFQQRQFFLPIFIMSRLSHPVRACGAQPSSGKLLPRQQ